MAGSGGIFPAVGEENGKGADEDDVECEGSVVWLRACSIDVKNRDAILL